MMVIEKVFLKNPGFVALTIFGKIIFKFQESLAHCSAGAWALFVPQGFSVRCTSFWFVVAQEYRLVIINYR